jgi:putative Ca2+/H+ antiporter (TMEM165/GDT1 family)
MPLGAVRLGVAAAVFPLVFLGELPDKTMFASLVLSTRGRPLAVWAGASLAFVMHVAIAVTVGVEVIRLVPHRWVQYPVAGLFAAGAVYSFLLRHHREPAAAARPGHRVVLTSAGVIFLAEWGDLTQILTADLAARYHSWASVGLASLLALVAVAGLAVVGGSRLLARMRVDRLRVATSVVLAGMCAYTLVGAQGG